MQTAIKNKEKKQKYYCSNPWTSLFIWGSGDVTHCCYSNFGSLGNINKSDLLDIWNGDKLNFIRKQIRKGDYIKAGCEHFCRAYRWHKYYGNDNTRLNIPEGLGRIEDFNIDHPSETPDIISLAMDWKCNFYCSHCRATRKSDGLSTEQISTLWKYAERAKILRLSNGEFTVNERTLDYIKKIGELDRQPVVFMNTNGHVSISKWYSYIESVKKFHLKFSLEGLNRNYENVRVGGNWNTFYINLLEARNVFNEKNKTGNDWRLYLNFCVMRSNFESLPSVFKFSINNSLPLVINPIHGMRHTDENFFNYEHIQFSSSLNNKIFDECMSILSNSKYQFKNELMMYLNYIQSYLGDKKLKISKKLLSYLKREFSDSWNDRFIYIFYKWKLDKRGLFYYLLRKFAQTRKRFLKRINKFF